MTETLTPSRLWKQMTPAQRLAAAEAFWADEESPDDQLQAALLIAQARKFRLKSVVGLEPARKARHLAGLPSLPDTVAARVLVLYHLGTQRPMMGAFLDALGIPHEDGLIQQDHVTPDAAKMAPAIADITGRFPSDDVRLYLNTLVCQDPESWGRLSEFVER
jgi:hypothetical protein